MKRVVIAIDGPSGSGKGTVSKILKEKLNLLYIDTGAMYRCIALKALKNNMDLKDNESLIDMARKCDISFSSDSVFLDGEDVSLDIRNEEVSTAASIVSRIKEIREIMVHKQREFAKDNNIIMEGRDITTVVLPDALYKFYLDASLEVRAKRRYEQNKEKNIDSSYEEVLENMRQRDYNDMHRDVGALKVGDGVTYIDSTNMTISDVVDKIINIVGSGSNES